MAALVSSGLSTYYEIKYQLNAMEVLELVEVLILKAEGVEQLVKKNGVGG